MKQLNTKIGKYVIGYLSITYIIYLLLPLIKLDHDVERINETYSLIFLLFVSIFFYMGCKSVPIKAHKVSLPQYSMQIENYVLVLLLVIVTCIVDMYLKDLVDMGLAHISLSLGDSYSDMLFNTANTNSFWGQLFVVFSPVRVFLFIYCIYYYNNISKVARVLFFMLFISQVVYSISKGQTVGIGNLVMLIFVPLFVKYRQMGKLSILKKYALIGLILFVVFFIVNQYMRADALGYELSDFYQKESLLSIVFGPQLGNGIAMLLSYVSHGYKGMNYCLQLPFEWTYGYGGSRALDYYLHSLFGFPSMFDVAYPMRVFKEFGYDCQMNWPTAFSWLASDFTFPGVTILMYFIAKLYCRVLKESLYYSNVISITLLYQLSIMILFLPMNNQAFQANDSFFITVGLFFFWLLSRKKYNNLVSSQNLSID